MAVEDNHIFLSSYRENKGSSYHHKMVTAMLPSSDRHNHMVTITTDTTSYNKQPRDKISDLKL